MKLTEEQKKQVAERLAEVALITLGRPTQYRYDRENLQTAFSKELEKMEAETEKSETEKAEHATGTGSVGTFDY